MKTNEVLMSRYQASLEKCNRKQRFVVENFEGPMYVVSGPGTGKTTMVTLRVAHLLSVQDVKPENILCFSFTNAACAELRKRLEDRIGGIAAHKVGVYTFHAFANEIIMSHIDYLGISNIRAINEIEKIELTKALIDGLNTDNPLRRLKGDEYFEVSRLTWLSQVMREEGLEASDVVYRIDAFLEELPNMEEYQYKRKYTDTKTGNVFQKGDPNPAKIQAVKDYMAFTRAAVTAMPKLQASISGQGYYDYADMITWAIGILSNNEGLRRFVQERYQYFIVDEFQDTSGSQLQLLELLTEYWMPDANVLMVGDPDQMIMGFQGAHAHSQEKFLDNFGELLKTVSMDDNYRSTPEILEAAHSVIIQNENRLRADSLNAAAYPKATGHMPQVREYGSPTEELADIARELQQMQKEGRDLSEVFCLFPKHSLYGDFILALDGMGIPYQVSRPIDVLSHRTARMVLTLFEYIAIECDRHRQGEGEHLIFEALHFPFIGASHADVSRITRYIWGLEKPRPSWFTVITDVEALSKAGCTKIEAITKAGHFIGEIMSQAFGKASVLEIYRTIMEQSGIMKWVMDQPDALLHLDILNSLHRFIDEQTKRKPYLSCYELTQIIADMRSERVRLDIQRTGGAKNGVQIMTFHASKGMEANRVYLIGCRKDLLDDTGGRGGTQYKLPPTITRTAFDDGGEQERRKLFYVGMTRARKELIVSYSNTDVNGKDRSKSKFVAEMLAHFTAEEKRIDVEALHIALYQSSAVTTVRTSADDGQALTEEELTDLLSGYKLSPTHLNVYLSCQAEFYLNYVLRVPKVKNMYAAFGSAVDEALRQLHWIGSVKSMVAKESKEADTDKQALLREMIVSKYGDAYLSICKMTEEEEIADLMETFERSMRQQRGYFPSQNSWENRLAYGKDQLLKFYNHYRAFMPGTCQTGYVLNNVFMDSIPLTGEVDNMIWVGKEEVVVDDWKTGNATKGISKVKHVVDLSNGLTPDVIADADSMGAYRRQIYIYKIMIDYHSTLTLKPQMGRVRFIESHDTNGTPVSVDVMFTNEEQALVEAQIRYAYKGIQSHQFNKGCNDQLCSACKFISETGIVLPGNNQNIPS